MGDAEETPFTPITFKSTSRTLRMVESRMENKRFGKLDVVVGVYSDYFFLINLLSVHRDSSKMVGIPRMSLSLTPSANKTGTILKRLVKKRI